MTQLAIPFAVQVAADCRGEKVNLRFAFGTIPTLRQLLRDVNEAFSNLFAQQRIHAIFDIGAAVIFNDRRCTWDRLEHSSQLYHTAQVYVFQPNLKDTPAELPTAIEASPFLSEPPLLTQRTPPKAIEARPVLRPSREPVSASKRTIKYGNGDRYTSAPTRPAVARMHSSNDNNSPSTGGRFTLSRPHDGRGYITGSPDGKEADGATPKRFALRPFGGEGNSPMPTYPWPRQSHPYNRSGSHHDANNRGTESTPPPEHRRYHSERDSEETAKPSSVPDPDLLPAPVYRRRNVSRPRLLSPERGDEGEDRGVAAPPREREPLSIVMGGSSSTRRSWERYIERPSRSSPGEEEAAAEKDSTELLHTQRGRLLSPSATVEANQGGKWTVHVTDKIQPSYSGSTSPSPGRISVLSVSREGRTDSPRAWTPPPHHYPSSAPLHQGTFISLREEREKVEARMHMPLDELRRSLRLEREEMERSLSAQRGESGRNSPSSYR